MNKHNLFIKKLQQRVLSINNSIESYFNQLRFFKKNFKKNEFIRNNRVFFGTSAVVILTLSYFLIPTMYNKDLIQQKIKNQLLKGYKIDIIFNEKIRYGLLPRPHFQANNLSIVREKREIGIAENFKIFVGIGEFFSFNNLNIKNLVFKKVDFNIIKDDLIFFEELLKTEPNENKIIFKKSNIFFQGEDDELLFLKKIKNSSFYYDSLNLENVFSSKNEIFNIPYKLIIKNDKFNKNIFVKFNSKKIRLDLESNTGYEDTIKKGLVNLLFINKDISLEYQLKKNSLKFASKGKKVLDGYVDFKPFYLKANLKYDGISTKNLFSNESILIDIVRSQILNNQNLNVKIDLDVKDITNSNELNNLHLEINLEQGEISLTNSKINWKDDLEFLLDDALLDYESGEISLIGKLRIDLKNINNFYQSFQVKKIHRKKIKNVELDFVYNFNKNQFRFDNVKVDKKSNSEVDEFITKYNRSKKNFFNKITFKNFVNDFFKNYSG